MAAGRKGGVVGGYESKGDACRKMQNQPQSRSVGVAYVFFHFTPETVSAAHTGLISNAFYSFLGHQQLFGI